MKVEEWFSLDVKLHAVGQHRTIVTSGDCVSLPVAVSLIARRKTDRDILRDNA